jgi:hypothetical protein
LIALLVVWLAIVVPITCHHGPMSLMEPGGHTANAGHASVPSAAHRDHAAGPRAHAAMTVHDVVHTTLARSQAGEQGLTALADKQLWSLAMTTVPLVLSLFAGVLPTGAAPPALAVLLFLVLLPLAIRPQWALSPPTGPPRPISSLATS